MIIIAHRGKMKETDKENDPKTFMQTYFTHGFGLEIDVQDVDVSNGTFHLGHDKTEHSICLADYVGKMSVRNIFFHAKNQMAAENLLHYREESGMDYDVFMHDNDKMALTLNGYLWQYPKRFSNVPSPRSILVMPDWFDFEPVKPGYYGYCTDQPERVKAILQEQMK